MALLLTKMTSCMRKRSVGLLLMLDPPHSITNGQMHGTAHTPLHHRTLPDAVLKDVTCAPCRYTSADAPCKEPWPQQV